jgi:hypothetical protein
MEMVCHSIDNLFAIFFFVVVIVGVFCSQNDENIILDEKNII